MLEVTGGGARRRVGGETVQQVVGGEVQDKGLSVRQQARKRLAFGDGRSLDEPEEQAILVVRQQFAFPADLSAPRGPVGDVGDQAGLLCDDAHGIGGGVSRPRSRRGASAGGGG